MLCHLIPSLCIGLVPLHMHAHAPRGVCEPKLLFHSNMLKWIMSLRQNWTVWSNRRSLVWHFCNYHWKLNIESKTLLAALSSRSTLSAILHVLCERAVGLMCVINSAGPCHLFQQCVSSGKCHSLCITGCRMSSALSSLSCPLGEQHIFRHPYL